MAIVLTHNAKYKPMSFDEMIRPYVMATEEYRTLEKGIADLDAEAENLRSIAEKDIVRNDDGSIDRKQSKGYAIKYMDYADSLDKQAEQLASKGLKGVNRKSLYDLQAQYKTNVVPIEDAVKVRAAEIAEQKEGMKDPTMRYSRNAAETSLDYYINNTAPTYDRLSGATLAAQTKDMVSSISKQMREDPRKWESILGGQYYQTKMQQGYTDEEILLAAANDPNAPRELTNIVRNVIDSTRLFDWEGARDSEGNLTDYGRELEDWAWKEASKGLWGAAGTTTYNIQSNKQWDINNAIEKEKQLSQIRVEEARKKKEIENEQSSIDVGQNMSRVPSGVSGQINENVQRLAGLRDLGNGRLSTTELDKQLVSINKVKEEIDTIIANQKNNIDKNILIDSVNRYLNPSNNSADKYKTIPQHLVNARNKLFKLHDELKKREESYVQNYKLIEEYASKYSHLGSTLFEKVHNGMLLEDAHEKEQNFRAILNPRNETDNNKAIDAIKIQIEGISEGYDNTDIGMFKVNAKGTKEEKVKATDVKAIMDNTSSISIDKDKDGKFRLIVTSNGADYRFKNIPEFTRIENTITGVYNFLRGFSKSELGIGSENGTVTVWDPSTEMRPDYNIYQIPGTDYYGAVVYNTATRDYTKHIISPMGNIEYSLSFSQEKQSGKYRDKILGEITNMALQSFLPKK
mgnify:CR=1 FL=1